MLELELKIQDTQQQVVEIFGGRAVSLYGSFVARKPNSRHQGKHNGTVFSKVFVFSYIDIIIGKPTII